MNTWTMAEAKRDVERGLLTEYQIYDSSHIDARSWSVSFSSKLGIEGGALVDARTKQDRTFRTMDAAVAALRAIGFRCQTLTGEL